MIHPREKVSEAVNSQSHPRNMTVQLSTPYTNPQHHNHVIYIKYTPMLSPQTDIQTDSILLIQLILIRAAVQLA